MAKLTLNSKLIRSLSALGGRNLVKTTEILAGTLAGLMGGNVLSDGSEVRVLLSKKQIILKPRLGKSVLKGRYYVYQKGNVTVISDKKTLELLKQLLLKIARERKQYLLSKYDDEALEMYGVSTDYILNLDKEINELSIVA